MASTAPIQPTPQMAKPAPKAGAGNRRYAHRDEPESEPRMPPLKLPDRLERERSRARGHRECPAHRAWVRRHHCCVPGCLRRRIECAHVRREADGGMGLKPSDCWSVSLCRDHHIEQHEIGELAFERRYGLDLRELAKLFVRRSPHRKKLDSGRAID